MNISNTQVYNLEGAIRGMRNPMASWDKSDSVFGYHVKRAKTDDALIAVVNEWISAEKMSIGLADEYELIQWLSQNGREVFDDVYKYSYLGPNDLDLMQRLIAAGPEHAKFLRQIEVSFDLTAPLFVFKEFDTYKVATTANSTSTMHKLASTPITVDCFEIDDYDGSLKVFDSEPYDYDVYMNECTERIIDICESLRKKYVETKDKRYWKELIRWLPESWLQTRTITLNYAVLRNMYFQRRNHKLSEWHYICEWIESLPYAKELICYNKNA